ncbi:MAG: hypothetical protein K1X66_01230 [Verrucomicrobiae bacterium]|nr:hypothetical protein [Verrucomicrobiae bacterium]
MTTPDSKKNLPPKKKGKHTLILCTGLLFIFFLFFIASLAISPKTWLLFAGKFLPVEIEMGSASWKSLKTLEIHDLKIDDELTVKTVTLQGDFAKIYQGFIESLTLDTPIWKISWEEIVQDQKQKAKQATKEFRRSLTRLKTPTRKKKLSFPLSFKNLTIKHGLIEFGGLGPGIPPLLIPLNITLQNFKLNTDEESLQVVEIPNFSLYSPFDPQARIFSFELLRVAFTPTGLLNQRVEKLIFLAPEIFIGQDLFWVTKYLSKQFQRLPKVNSARNSWSIGEFEIRGGAVTIASLGQPNFRLPLVFEAEQTNLVLTTFSDLHLKSRFRVPKVTLDYRHNYGLYVEDLEGELEFALPRNQINANNIVNRLIIRQIAWKELQAKNLWLSVTFDENGIYGGFGGAAYSGYLDGQASLFFTNNFQWTISLAATHIKLLPITQTLSPDKILIEGVANGKIVAHGQSTVVHKTEGEFIMQGAGKFEIITLDELIKKLPKEWNHTKQDLTKILLEAFRDYHYSKGQTTFAYAPPLSSIKIHFDGKEGQRNFDLNYHHLPKEQSSP